MNNLSCGQRKRLLGADNTIAHNKKLWASLQKPVCENQRADPPNVTEKKNKKSGD